MALSYTSYAFNLKACTFWPSLVRRQALPDELKSAKAERGRPSNLGLGVAEALSHLLCGLVTLGKREEEGVSASYVSNQAGELRHVHSARASAGADVWRGMDGMKGAPILCVVEAAASERASSGSVFPEVLERWRELLDELCVAVGHPAPYAKEDLAGTADGSTPARRAMMAVCDAVYFALKEADQNGTHQLLDGGGAPYGEDPGLLGAVLGLSARPAVSLASGLQATLSALCATGGTALLTGPTGTFKTSTAVRAAQASGASLTVVKGRPGIEDRDFFGGVVPTEAGPAWVDGPVTTAFRKAQAGNTVLLMDEVLRFEPVFLGALVGLLDAATPEELAARSIKAHGPGRHYVAALPTGEAVAAPCSRLTLIATTNMGAGYHQAGQAIDEALLGRFEVLVEVEEADSGLKRALYEKACSFMAGRAKVGADLLAETEAYVNANQIDDGGLFGRRAHPRLMLNMARHMSRLAANGMGERSAAVAAAQVTVATYCVPRDPSGVLDKAAAKVLLEEVASTAHL